MQGEEQMRLNHLLDLSLLSDECFWGVSCFSGCLLAEQTDLRPLIPLFHTSAFRIMGSLNTSSCQEWNLGHHPNICSSAKPLHTLLYVVS